jgi:hypothetical protein
LLQASLVNAEPTLTGWASLPGTGGRNTTAPDINEFLLIGLDDKLDVGNAYGHDDKSDRDHDRGGDKNKDFGKTHSRR